MDSQPSLFEEPKPAQPTPDVKIESSWKEALSSEFSSEYFGKIKDHLVSEKEAGNTIYPPGNLIFNAFDNTPFDKVKLVILGQDPYHGRGQAHGLCFSVPDGISAPPSLLNIYKEISADMGIPTPSHGNLQKWTTQGVLLLNAILTVRAGNAASHHDIGWEAFTNAAISKLSESRSGLVFLLWGKYAQEKEALIDTIKHLVLKAAHPSPYAASSGFFGCKHFSKANDYLVSQSKDPIDWSV